MNTNDYRPAPSGEGPHAPTWKDKPHRLVYDLASEVERLQMEVEQLKLNIQELEDARNSLSDQNERYLDRIQDLKDNIAEMHSLKDAE